MRVSFLLPKCTPENGHGRYVIELSRRLARNHAVVIYAGTFWPPLRAIAQCRKLPVLQRPAVARLATLWAESLMAVRRHAGSIVHVQGADAPIGNVITAHFCNQAARPFIQANGNLYSRFNYGLGAAVEKYSMTRSGVRRIIAVSATLRDDIVNHYGVDPGKVSVLHHGVDIGVFEPGNRARWRSSVRAAHGIENEEFVILFVGGDYRRKGLIPLLEAAALLPRNVKVLAVGTIPDRALSRVISERNLSPRVLLLPSTNNVASFYAAADCFVLPTQYDTFSLATLEAMATGLPVVVSRRAGVSEILTHDVDSLVLADPADTQELTLSLKNLITDEAQRRRLETAARATAEKHSWEQVAAQTVQVYEQVLAG